MDVAMSDDGSLLAPWCERCDKLEQLCICAGGEAALVVDELFRLFWGEWGAQLCNFEFYSRRIPPLQDYYGHDAVAAALAQYHAMLRSRTSSQIRDLRRNAAWLKRDSRKVTPTKRGPR
jgi:hypothetical protein